ncbi:MAG: DUF2634 domain-containing protein [Clostridia bacterium]|nr:DUF2634 domain-containing protein [Clostridia bacterium]
MIPDSEYYETDGAVLPSKTYKINFEENRFDGFIEGEEALQQAIYMALRTERYKYPIFSHNYGTDYSGILGEEYMVAMGRIKTAVTDSLTADDRIEKIDGFEFEKAGRKIKVKFTVTSVFGETEIETEVG